MFQAGRVELPAHGLLKGNAEVHGHQIDADHHVGKLFGYSAIVDLSSPLEAFEEFTGFDGHTLGEIFGRMKLSPFALIAHR